MTRSTMAEDTYTVTDHRKFDKQLTEGKKDKDHIGTLVAALPLIGAVGTVFVWIFSAVYVGNVELITNKPFRLIIVQAYNEKGSESEFHSPRFQLMPGDYLLQVTLDNKTPAKYVAAVKFHEKTSIPLEDPKAPTTEAGSGGDDPPIGARSHKRWWQFWRK